MRREYLYSVNQMKVAMAFFTYRWVKTAIGVPLPMFGGEVLVFVFGSCFFYVCINAF